MIILHRRGTTGEWYKADLLADQLPEVLLKDGEFAIEELADGSRHVKIGDGHSKFCDLPYIDARAEALFFKELSIAKAAFDTKLSELTASHKKLITSTSQQLAQQIEHKASEILVAAEAGDEQTLADAKRFIIDEVSVISTDVAKNASTIVEVKNNAEKQLSNTKAQLTNDLLLSANKLNSEIHATADNAATALEREVTRLDELFRTLLTDSIEQHNNINNSTFEEIALKIKVLNESVKQLGAADASLNNTIIGVQNTFRAATSKLTTELGALAEKHEAELGVANDEIAKQADIRQAADAEIAAFIQKHLVKIYAELADLVDDDILILEKAFSVENSLSHKIRIIVKELEELKRKFYELTPEGLEVIETRINQKLDEVTVALKESLCERADALDGRINNVKETFDTIINDTVYVLKQADSDILGQLETVNKNAIKEIAAVKADASERISTIEAAFDAELAAIVTRYKAADDKLFNEISEAEQRLGTKIADTRDSLISEIENTKSFLLVELDSTNKFITDTKNELDAVIAESSKQQAEALSEVENSLTERDAELATNIADAEKTFAAGLDELATKTAADIENVAKSVGSSYIKFNESDDRLYIGETADSIILSGGTAIDL